MRLARFTVIAVLLSGCAINGVPDTNVQLTIAAQTLRTSEDLLVTAERNGVLPVEVQPQVKASVLSARVLLRTAFAHNGDPASAALAAEALAAIQSVQNYQATFAPAKGSN